MRISRLLMAVALLCAVSDAQIKVSPLLQPHQTFVDQGGAPCAGCALFSYTAGTTIPTPTYQDASGSVPNTNPIVLSVQGGANIWVDTSKSYKFVLKNTVGTTLWTVDNVPSPGGGGSSGASVVFNPTGSQIITQPSGTSLYLNSFNNILYAQTGSSLSTMCGSFGGSPGQVIISLPVTVSVTTSLPANCAINVMGGGTITVSSGTLTINGPFVAPSSAAVFTGSVAGLSTTRPEWFGGTGQAPFLAAWNACVSTGCNLMLNLGTYVSPFDGVFQPSFSATKLNVHIIGSGMPSINGANTAMINGTIIQKTLNLSGTGQTVQNLGIDAGSLVYGSTTACGDGLSFTNSPGTSIPAPMVNNRADHVTVLLCSPTAAFHGVLIENANGFIGNDIAAIYGIYNVVVKSSGVRLSKIYASGSTIASLYIKADSQFSGNISGISVNGFIANSAYGAASAGVMVEAQSAVLNAIHLNDIQLSSTSFGYNIIGGSSSFTATDIDIAQSVVLSSASNCLISGQFVSRLLVSGFICNAPASNSGAAFSISASNAHYDNVVITIPLVGGFLGNGPNVLISNSTVQGNGTSSGSLYGATVTGGNTLFSNFDASTFIQTANSIINSGATVTKSTTLNNVAFTAGNSLGYTPAGWLSLTSTGAFSLGASAPGDGHAGFEGDPFSVRGKSGGSGVDFNVQNATATANHLTVQDSGVIFITPSVYGGSGSAMLCVNGSGQLFRGTATTCP